MDKTYEIVNGGGRTTFKVKDHDYDTVEFSLKKYLEDDKGKPIIDSGYTVFFSNADFKKFFEPFVTDLKARFDNEQSSS